MTDPAASPHAPPVASNVASRAAPGGRRACLALILLWLVSALPLGLLYLTLQPSPDQSQFDYMALISTMARSHNDA